MPSREQGSGAKKRKRHASGEQATENVKNKLQPEPSADGDENDEHVSKKPKKDKSKKHNREGKHNAVDEELNLEQDSVKKDDDLPKDLKKQKKDKASKSSKNHGRHNAAPTSEAVSEHLHVEEVNNHSKDQPPKKHKKSKASNNTEERDHQGHVVTRKAVQEDLSLKSGDDHSEERLHKKSKKSKKAKDSEKRDDQNKASVEILVTETPAANTGDDPSEEQLTKKHKKRKASKISEQHDTQAQAVADKPAAESLPVSTNHSEDQSSKKHHKGKGSKKVETRDSQTHASPIAVTDNSPHKPIGAPAGEQRSKKKRKRSRQSDVKAEEDNAVAEPEAEVVLTQSEDLPVGERQSKKRRKKSMQSDTKANEDGATGEPKAEVIPPQPDNLTPGDQHSKSKKKGKKSRESDVKANEENDVIEPTAEVSHSNMPEKTPEGHMSKKQKKTLKKQVPDIKAVESSVERPVSRTVEQQPEPSPATETVTKTRAERKAEQRAAKKSKNEVENEAKSPNAEDRPQETPANDERVDTRESLDEEAADALKAKKAQKNARKRALKKASKERKKEAAKLQDVAEPQKSSDERKEEQAVITLERPIEADIDDSEMKAAASSSLQAEEQKVSMERERSGGGEPDDSRMDIDDSTALELNKVETSEQMQNSSDIDKGDSRMEIDSEAAMTNADIQATEVLAPLLKTDLTEVYVGDPKELESASVNPSAVALENRAKDIQEDAENVAEIVEAVAVNTLPESSQILEKVKEPASESAHLIGDIMGMDVDKAPAAEDDMFANDTEEHQSEEVSSSQAHEKGTDTLLDATSLAPVDQETNPLENDLDANQKAQSQEQVTVDPMSKHMLGATRISGVSYVASSISHNKDVGRKEVEGVHNPEQLQQSISLSSKNTRVIRLEVSDEKDMTNWTVSNPVGAILASVEPIFSLDEEYLLLACDGSIRVFARASSLLVRTLGIGKKIIASFHLSEKNPRELYVSFTDGYIQHWNWMQGTRLKTWRLGYTVTASASTVVQDLPNVEITFTADHSNGEHRLTAHQLESREGSETKYKTLLRNDRPISLLKVLERGTLLVAAGDKRVIVGQRETTPNSNIESLKFTFWSFDVSYDITCIEARRSERIGADKGDTQPRLDVVIGLRNGSLQLYRDIIVKLKNVGKTRVASSSSTMHWHRNSVGSVKWSTDGNYLVSGGLETVLVIWQLDTGGKTYLPHLAAPIESITVSPTGTTYAIRLADNSAMIISTQELTPAFNVSGALLPTSIHLGTGIRESLKSKFRRGLLRRPPASCPNSAPPRMLMAVPTVLSSTDDLPPSLNASLLQTVDVRSGLQFARQALTRTKITDLNIGPQGYVIDEPNVVLLESSHDGTWLATIEEWAVPLTDLKSLAVDKDEALTLQIRSLEISLKFWSWNEESKHWELVARVDKPHSSADVLLPSKGLVLDLTAHHVSNRFITFGDDWCVKIWKPISRLRNNIPVKNSNGQELVNWTCHRKINIPPSPYTEHVNESSSRISISPDGSMLAVGQSHSKQSMVWLADMYSGKVHSRLPNLIAGTLVGLSLLDKYLIIVGSDSLSVWNPVDNEMKYSVALGRSSTGTYLHGAHLAVDIQSDVFAVAIPQGTTTRKRFKTKIAVFNPNHMEPLLEAEHFDFVLTLCSGQRGFYAMDASARIVSILPTSKLPAAKKLEFEEESGEENHLNGIDMILREGRPKKLTEPVKEEQLSLSHSDELPHVTTHQLHEVFAHYEPHTMPPVTTLFENVAELLNPRVYYNW